MDVEPEPVAEAVAERAGEVAPLDHVPRGRVGVDAGHAGADRVEPRLLRREHDVVRLPHLVVELAGGERARVVGDVAVDVAAGVDHDELARLDHAVARARVRPRAGRARADDRLERRLVGALLVEEPLDVPGDVALAAADEPHLAHEPLEHPVGDRARPPERVELALVLDGAQLLDEPLARHELEPALAQLSRRTTTGGRSPRSRSGRPGSRRASRSATRFVCTVSTPSTASRRLDVAEVGEEAHAVRLDEERGVRAVEAGQVEDVDEVRDEERLLEQLPQPVDRWSLTRCSLR